MADINWHKRYTCEIVLQSGIAASNPGWGWVMRQDSRGKIGLYRWDVARNDLALLLGDEVSYSPLFIRMAPNGRYLYFLQDKKGNELGHLTRMASEGGGVLVDVTPEMSPYSLRGLEISRAGNLLTFTAVSQAEGYQLVCMLVMADGNLGPSHVFYQQEMEFWEAAPSYGGELVAIQSTHRTGKRRYCALVFDASSGELVGELWDGPEYSVEVVAFSPVPGDLRLLLTTTVTGFRRPVIWQPATGERHDITVDDLPGELVPLDWSPDGKQLLLSHFDRAVQQLYLYDVAAARAVRLDHPPGTFGSYGGVDKGAVSFTPDGRLLAHWQNAANPLQLIELEAQTGVKRATLIGTSDTPAGRPFRSVNFPSSDGVLVQGWLAVPEGDGPFPTILHMHGGPHVVMTESFSPDAQAWLEQGFAYMSINYRGSTTFGEAFRQKIWGEIGRWELEDMVAARAWLVEQGISDSGTIILHGASYGGYLTLWGLSRRPDLWAGGIALVAVADWVINYEDAAGAMQGAFRNWFLGSPEEKLAQYQASSPITYAEQVQAPLFIYQGKNDTRTSARQMEMYEAKMKALGKDITVQWFDAGHTSSSDVEKDIALQEDMMQFARKIVSKS